MKRVTITRRTRNIGWAWCTTTYDDPTPPESPEFTGTLRQVFAHIANDKTYQAIGNTFHLTRFFVGGMPVVDPWGFSCDIDMLMRRAKDSVTVKVRDAADLIAPF
jgi:hypothetical protein